MQIKHSCVSVVNRTETQRQSPFTRQSYTPQQCTQVYPGARFWSLWTTKIPWREEHLTHWASEHSSHAPCPWQHTGAQICFPPVTKDTCYFYMTDDQVRHKAVFSHSGVIGCILTMSCWSGEIFVLLYEQQFMFLMVYHGPEFKISVNNLWNIIYW